jgi:hypothetical protein
VAAGDLAIAAQLSLVVGGFSANEQVASTLSRVPLALPSVTRSCSPAISVEP